MFMFWEWFIKGANTWSMEALGDLKLFVKKSEVADLSPKKQFRKQAKPQMVLGCPRKLGSMVRISGL